MRGHPGVAIPLSPVFDELWDLKGRHATFEDMHRMVLGGKEAAEVRQEVADALQKGKGRETKFVFDFSVGLTPVNQDHTC